MKFFRDRSAQGSAVVSRLAQFHQSQQANAFGSVQLQHEHDRLAVDETISFDDSCTSRPHATAGGHGPSGTMKVSFVPSLACPGFSSGGTIVVDYHFPSGLQSRFHPNPGIPFDPASRRAYLPNTAEARRTLTRFRYSFLAGHMFRIAKSETSGLENQVCWNPRIPNKTGLSGGLFGFPDPHYFAHVNREMDALGIPRADDCLPGPPSSASQQSTGYAQDNQFPVTPGTVMYTAPSSLGAVTDAIFEPFMVCAAASGARLPPPCVPSTMAMAVGGATTFKPAKIITASDIDGGLAPLPPPLPVPPLPPPLPVPKRSPSHPGHPEAEECAICLDLLSTAPAVRILSCGHIFHRTCITDALSLAGGKCPSCRQPVGNASQGKSPSGTMKVEIIDKPCPGFTNSPSSISIIYNMEKGSQRTYHEDPGQPYHGTCRVGYLPNTFEARQLLFRLIWAFSNGMVFRVGASLTTGKKSVITWASIHHKTSLHGGSHGFPDSNYLRNCHESLDALYIPKADVCFSTINS